MKERPILFSGPMIRAILAGNKTVTRRMVRIDNSAITEAAAKAGRLQRGLPSNPVNLRLLGPYVKCDAPPGSATVSCRVPCPFGVAGDRLWVRETWRAIERADGIDGILFAADDSFVPIAPNGAAADKWVDAYNNGRYRANWRPSIFLPRWASRISLEVMSVRVERLHELTNREAMAEGIPQLHGEAVMLGLIEPRGHLDDGAPCSIDEWDNATSTENFARLWDTINGRRCPWASNPLVWRIEFKLP